RVAPRGFTSTPPRPFSTRTPPGQVKARSPWGPFTFTVRPSPAAVTPAGTTPGFLPIRDIAYSIPARQLPACPAPSKHVAEDLAAHIFLARPRVRHHALGCRQDGNAEPVGHAGEIAHRLIDPAAGRGDTGDLAD